MKKLDERELSYKVHGGHSYTEIFKVEKNENSARIWIDIYWMSDRCLDSELIEFVNKEFPELDGKPIDFIHDGPELWLSDYNLGKPKGCFQVVTIFYKK